MFELEDCLPGCGITPQPDLDTTARHDLSCFEHFFHPHPRAHYIQYSGSKNAWGKAEVWRFTASRAVALTPRLLYMGAVSDPAPVADPKSSRRANAIAYSCLPIHGIFERGHRGRSTPMSVMGDKHFDQEGGLSAGGLSAHFASQVSLCCGSPVAYHQWLPLFHMPICLKKSLVRHAKTERAHQCMCTQIGFFLER